MRCLLLPLACFFMQSCATTTSTPIQKNNANDVAYQQHMQNLASIQEFAIQGKIGIQTENKGFSGGLDWHHAPLHDVIALYTPLGSQIARIEKTSEKVVLEDDRGNSFSADSAEILTQQMLGWQLPLSGLAKWSIGRPTSSHIDSIRYNEKGEVILLSQDGWDIEYEEYADSDGIRLPRKIYLRSHKVNIKLLVKSRNYATK